MPRTGFEPAHPCERCDLNTVRLPISPPGHFRSILKTVRTCLFPILFASFSAMYFSNRVAKITGKINWPKKMRNICKKNAANRFNSGCYLSSPGWMADRSVLCYQTATPNNPFRINNSSGSNFCSFCGSAVSAQGAGLKTAAIISMGCLPTALHQVSHSF